MVLLGTKAVKLRYDHFISIKNNKSFDSGDVVKELDYAIKGDRLKIRCKGDDTKVV